jgi:2-octaprenylphenol hydroxylase
VATVRTAEPHGETARQRFLPEGPLAFLPLGESHTCSIVWSTGHAHAEALLALDDSEFRAELESAFGSALGAVSEVGPREGFPLRMRHAEHYVVERVALAGDAAHTIHPLAGQGVNLGLLDAAALAEVLLAAAAAGRDPGGLATLRRYERWRRGDNLLMIAAMEGFKRLFAGSLPPLAWARNLGLEITDRLPPLKSLFMRRALGLGGDLPRLARGLPPDEAA